MDDKAIKILESNIWNKIDLYRMYLADEVQYHEVTKSDNSDSIRRTASMIVDLTDLLNTIKCLTRVNRAGGSK